MPILAQGPELGLQSLLQANLLDPRAAAEGSQSVFYEYGLISTPWGFAKFDLTSGLNSGDPVLAVFPYKEIDGFDHILAVTTQKIFDHDAVNEEWDDKTQSGLTMQSAIDTPMSWATVGHDDTDIHLDDDSGKAQAFYHIVVCNGGLGNIQRWAGRRETDFADLLMTAGDYGAITQTTHRALQVSMSQQNRMILLSPQEFNSSTNLWTENNQMVRWPQIAKLQSWAGTGAGFVNLQDTGGLNVWSASLGAQHIIYQTNSIWTLNYVGGTTVYSPTPAIPDLGLLAAHLLISHDNVHYFIGTDLNVYAYFGGSVKQVIGDPIHRFLQADLDKQYKNRMWIAMGPNRRRLWIFIVEQGSTFITKAYYRNMQTGAWGVRDFKNKFTSTKGITAVSLVGGQTVVTGDSYAEALDTLSAFPADISEGTAGDVTQRYGDVLIDGTANQIDFSDLGSNKATPDFTDIDFSKAVGGLELDWSAAADNTVLLADNTTAYSDWSTFSGKLLKLSDGSDTVGMAHGTHFYRLTDVCAVNTGATEWSMTVHIAPRGAGFATSVCSGGVPDQFAGDTSGAFYDPSGQTYRDVIQERETRAQMLLGDATGFIYQMDETYTTDDGYLIGQKHITPVFDSGEIGKKKRWKGITIVAKGERMKVSYRISDFDDPDTGWNTLTDLSLNTIAHYKLNDNEASTAVVDSIGAHNGIASVNTNTFSTTGKVGLALNMGGNKNITVLNHADFDFGDGVNDSPFSVSAIINVTLSGSTQSIITKWATGKQEWLFEITGPETLRLKLFDQSNAAQVLTSSDVALSEGVHFVVATYDGRGGMDAGDGITLYIDGKFAASTAITSVAYIAMEVTSVDVVIGSDGDSGTFFQDTLDDTRVFNTELSLTDVKFLHQSGHGTEELSGPYETIQTLTSDFERYNFYNNVTSERIQYLFSSSAGSQFNIREFEVFDPQMQDNR